MQQIQNSPNLAFFEKLKTKFSPELVILITHYSKEYENKKIDKETLKNFFERIEKIHNGSTTSQLTQEEKKIIFENSKVPILKLQKRNVSEISSSTVEPEPKKIKVIQTIPIASTSAKPTTAPTIIMDEECIMIENEKKHPMNELSSPEVLHGQSVKIERKQFFKFLLMPDLLLTQMREFHTLETQKSFFKMISQKALNLNVGLLKNFLREHYLKQIGESEFVEIVKQMKMDYSISRGLNHFITDLVYERNEEKEIRELNALRELFKLWKRRKFEHLKELNDLMSRDEEFINNEVLKIKESIQHGEIKKYLEIVERFVQMISGDAVNVFEMYLKFENKV
jgi:hypothetical protein